MIVSSAGLDRDWMMAIRKPRPCIDWQQKSCRGGTASSSGHGCWVGCLVETREVVSMVKLMGVLLSSQVESQYAQGVKGADND